MQATLALAQHSLKSKGGGGEENVIAFFSKSLSRSERNYCVTHKELLAVVVAVKTYHHYLRGRQFLIRTDHGALKWLLKFKNPEGQLARWLEHLGTYDFDIQHRSGICHGNADALLRRPCVDCRCCDRAKQKGESASAADSAMADVALCDAFQGSGKTTDGDSLPSHQVDPKPLPEGQEFQNRSSSSTKAFVVMGATNDLRASQIANDDLRKIVVGKESCHSCPAWKDVSIENKRIRTYWSQWDLLSLRNGVLCRWWESETGDEVRWQFVIPSSLRNDILHELHTMDTAGHLGVNKTLERVKERFYWPGCTKDVKD